MLKMQLVVAERLEDDGYMLQVLGPRSVVYQDIIKEHQHEPAKERSEHVIHQRLESRWCVGETEGHHQELIVSLMSAKHRFADVLRVHPHLMVAGAEVELGEETRTMELIQELVHHWDRELILGGLCIKGVVVDVEPPGLVRLADQQHRRWTCWP